MVIIINNIIDFDFLTRLMKLHDQYKRPFYFSVFKTYEWLLEFHSYYPILVEWGKEGRAQYNTLEGP